MHDELSDYEWTAIKPMLPFNGEMTVACSMPSLGFSGQERHGAICQQPMVPAPPVTIASFGDERLAYATRLWMRFLPVMARQCG